MNRGAGKRNIFIDNDDKNLFLEIIDVINSKYSTEIHAYCLMDNPYHLFERTPEANLSLAMKYLNCLYTKKYNFKRNTDGPIFRGRYKAMLIDAENYLLQVCRYIHLKNPVPCKSGIRCRAPILPVGTQHRNLKSR